MAQGHNYYFIQFTIEFSRNRREHIQMTDVSMKKVDLHLILIDLNSVYKPKNSSIL